MWQVKRQSSGSSKNGDGRAFPDRLCQDWSCLPGPVFERIMEHADFGRSGGARLACKSWLRSLTRGRTQLLYCIDTGQWRRKLALIQSAFGQELQHVDLVMVEGADVDRTMWVTGYLTSAVRNFALLGKLRCEALSMRLYVSSQLPVPLDQLPNIKFLEIGPRVVAINSLLPGLAHMARLQKLEITVFEDEGELPGHWSALLQQLTQVRHISLDIQTTSDAALCPSFTAGLADIQRLKELRLACRQLPDFAGIASGLRARAFLTALRLEGQWFTLSDLRQLAELRSLRELYLVAAACYPSASATRECECGSSGCQKCRQLQAPAGVLQMFAGLTALRQFKYTVAHQVVDGQLVVALADECRLTDDALQLLSASWRQLERFHYRGYTAASRQGLGVLAAWPSDGFCVDVDPEVRRSSSGGASRAAGGPLLTFTCPSQLGTFVRDMQTSPLFVGTRSSP